MLRHTVLGLTLACTQAVAQLDVQGRILFEGVPAAGAVVTASVSAQADTTGADGTFHLYDASVGVQAPALGHASLSPLGFVRLTHDGLRVTSVAEARRVTAELYQCNGELVGRHSLTCMSPGRHHLPLYPSLGTASQVFVLRLTTDRYDSVLRLTPGTSASANGQSKSTAPGETFGKAAAGSGYLLTAAYGEYVPATMGLQSLTTVLPDIALDSVLLERLAERLDTLPLCEHLGLAPASSGALSGNPGWTQYHFASTDCKCIEETAFSVAYRPGGSANTLVYFLQGGGACWPGMTRCQETADFAVSTLMYAQSDGANPLAGWPFMLVPYCDGSVHMGDNNSTYNGRMNWHWGLRNNSAALHTVHTLHPDLDTLVIVGASAGGYGTHVAAILGRSTYPRARIYVVNDAGPGLFDPAQPTVWESVTDAWGIIPRFPSECSDCGDQVLNLYAWQLQRDPRLRIGFYSSYRDATIGTSFLGMTGAAFENLLLTSTGALRAQFPGRYARFIEDGTHHCSPGLTTSIGSVTFGSWIGMMIDGDDGWVDLLE